MIRLEILTTNYNHGLYLPELIESVARQHRPGVGMFVIDDASKDDSVDILTKAAAKHAWLRFVVNEQNRGIQHNIHQLLHQSQAEFISFQAADDILLSGFVEQTLSAFERYPQAGLCSGLSRLIDASGKEIGLCNPNPFPTNDLLFIPPRDALQTFMHFGCWIQGNTTSYPRKVLLNAGGFRPELHSFCDSFVQRLIALQHGSCFIPRPIAAWRRLQSGYSATTGADPKISREIQTCAVTLMREQPALFPESYIRAWEKRWIFTTVTARADQSREKLLNELSVLLPGSALRALKSFLIFLLNFAVKFVWLGAIITLVPQDACRRAFFLAKNRFLRSFFPRKR